MDDKDKKNKEQKTPAADLIERLEAETGSRLGDDNGLVMAGLLGAVSREMGQSPPSYRKRDDVVVGLYIQHQMSPEGKQQRKDKEMLADLLRSGMSPDAIAAILGSEWPKD